MSRLFIVVLTSQLKYGRDVQLLKQRLLTLAHTHTQTDTHIHLQLWGLGIGLGSFIFPVSVSLLTRRPSLIFLGAYIFPGRFLW